MLRPPPTSTPLSLHDALPICDNTIVRDALPDFMFNGKPDRLGRSRACPEGSVPMLRVTRSEEHTSELQSRLHLVCRLLLEKKKIMQRKNWRMVCVNADEWHL